MINQVIIEFIGTFIFLLIILVTTSKTIMGDLSVSPIVIIITLLIAIGMFCIQLGGSHFNPAVTFTRTIQGKIPVSTCCTYIIAQLLAGLFAYCLYKIIHDKYIKK